MRSPLDVLLGRFEGLPKVQIARRTVPCYKYVLEPEGERLRECLLVDSRYLYRYPFENLSTRRALAVKARYLLGRMDHLRLREYQPGHCRYVHPQTRVEALRK